MKYYTFIATEIERPHSKWFFAAGIDETSLTGTLRNLCDGQVTLDRTDTYLLATCIVHHKTRDLLKALTVKKHFHFSPFETLETGAEFGTPDYQAGGLFIWLLKPSD